MSTVSHGPLHSARFSKLKGLELQEFALLGVVVALFIAGAILKPDTFPTWANIRNRIIKKIGATAMGAVEKGVEIFKIISGPEGIGGLWQMLMEKLGNVKDMIFEKVKDFVQDRIITAGITWLIGLLNPAAAFIKAKLGGTAKVAVLQFKSLVPEQSASRVGGFMATVKTGGDVTGQREIISTGVG